MNTDSSLNKMCIRDRYNVYLGSICGRNYGRIENCYSNSTVYGTESDEQFISRKTDYAGGICGYSTNNIISCYNMGNVSNSGGDYAAGICAYYMGTEIIDCYNTGNISSKRYAAGIFAYRNSSQINTVEYCYNTGNITGTHIGGITAVSVSYTHLQRALTRTTATQAMI